MTTRTIKDCDGCDAAEDVSSRPKEARTQEVMITVTTLAASLVDHKVDLCPSCLDKVQKYADPMSWPRSMREKPVNG